ncbi:basic membrane protein A [Tessaracoccus bendigoensis DSM 12906]|uniref:Basic membrane protein A n=1 Tax=Tessaracoccus bendigoensis DSM 12906 TaxID=1123357 RepID=A0A1M6I866_9ACTN|nr:BMP family ABC transporter substrate-binding protein [Tessaracoccus bendigoensis]SHJ30654.1 basic membrane protein A [Tessaracoccus bendigoensis DSM 12906]
MKKPLMSILALVSASALTLAGCAEPPGTGSPAPETPDASATSTSGGDASDFLACMVSDAGGFDDKSFNETAYNGMMNAKEELGIQTKQIESNAEGEYAGNVQSMIAAKCNIIITVGFALASATEAAAKQNPDVHFAIVDNSSFEGVDNAKGLIFNTAQPAYMAGYAAAAMSTSGTVGTFGGAKYPTVTIFMDGFVEGVAHYNETKGASVKVIGWDDAAQDGQFVGGNKPFGDIPGGKNTAATLIAQGADIIMPVAGPAGLGALQAAQESNGKVNAIWVDTDGFISAPEFGPQIMTSVMKAMDVAVFDTIKSAIDGDFSSDPFVGTLENDGVSLAPFHDFESKMPEGLQSELDQIRDDIISGKITIKSPAQPK